MTWEASYYGDKGAVTGKARCSTQSGTNNNETWTNPTISSSLPDSSGQYCYCQIDGYTPLNGTSQPLSAPWVFVYDYGLGNANDCADYCAGNCGYNLMCSSADCLAFRSAMFNAVQ